MFLQPPARLLFFLAAVLCAFTASVDVVASASDRPAAKNQHLIFGKGTPQELEVYKISGRISGGPTVMILGGIHGNEPGGYLTADLYTDIRLKRGNLIVVPRANFRSIIDNRRGSGGDMNRKFAGTLFGDPEKNIVDMLKSLMAESDALLTLHDGSGFFRPEWISPVLNPKRYGQSVIADAAVYTVPASGKTLFLQQNADRVLHEVNKEIGDPQYAFHFLNMRTASENSLYKEHRKSATYYALTEVGIPAFCVETSHGLPNLETKIRQHSLVINAFLKNFGVEIEQPGVVFDAPALRYLVVSVDDNFPFAVPNGQTLLVAPGATVEIVDVRANYERGILIAVQGLETFNSLRKPFTISRKTTVSARKDTILMGQIDIAPLPRGELFPRIAGNPRIAPAYEPTPASLPSDPLASLTVGASLTSGSEQTSQAMRSLPQTAAGENSLSPYSGIEGFLLEVDGRPVEMKPGDTLSVAAGALIRLIDFKTGAGVLSDGILMHLAGVALKDTRRHTDDKGLLVDTAKDLRSASAVKGRGAVYVVQAEQGKQVLAACFIKLVQPKLTSVTLKFKGHTKTIGVGKRIEIPPGTPVEILGVKLEGGITAGNLRLTLGGHSVAPSLPQVCIMRDIALNLAVFNGNALAGKVTWAP